MTTSEDLPMTERTRPGRPVPRRHVPSGRRRVPWPGRIGRVLVWALVGLNLFLIAWMFLTALRNSVEYVEHPIGLPIPPQVDNFVKAWTVGNFGGAFLNSVVATVVGSTLAVAIGTPAAYALSRSTRRVAGPLTIAFVLGLGVPGQVLLIPVYLGLAQTQQHTGLPLLNSVYGLILVLIGLNMPFTVFVLTGFFSSLPGELEEAAALDGLSAVSTFLRIMLPLARSGLMTALILAAIGSWNETLFSLVLLTDKASRTLPIALIQVLDSSAFSGTDWGTIFAGITLLVLPMLLIFTWLGRRIVEGMTVGVGK